MCGVLGLPDSDILRWCRHSPASFCPASQMQERVQILHGIQQAAALPYMFFGFDCSSLSPRPVAQFASSWHLFAPPLFLFLLKVDPQSIPRERRSSIE